MEQTSRQHSTVPDLSGEAEEVRLLAGQLALEMIHEIRNPLEALSHLTYLTLQEPGDRDKVIRYMQMAEEQMATLNGIVSQTLGFARTSPTSKPNDLAAVAEAAIRIHHRAIAAKKIHLVKDLPAGILAEVRSGELLQVLSNLIVNALDSLPSDGLLWVRLRKCADRVHILIADNGHGIPAEQTVSIFQPFFTTKGDNGTGLGLPLSKKIIERHGGCIGVRSSTRPGRSGTTFRISIPA